MKNMHSTKWLVVVLLLWSAVASAQFVFSLTERQKVELILSEIQQVMQQARTGSVELPLGLTFSADGKQTDSAGVVATVNAVLTALPTRGVAFSNPLPSKLGTFWDFQITDPSIEFDGDSCHVTCGYFLLANGVRTGSGRIDLVRFGRGYRIVRLDGLLPFLGEELNAAKAEKRVRQEEK